MDNKKLKVYFMGAGHICVKPFEALLNSDKIELLGVATQPDKPSGRKRIPMPTPLGEFALNNNVDIDKPLSVNSEEFISYLTGLEPDIIVVASFGQILKKELLSIPKISCVNLHASILPEYRGASPIAQAILDMREETGISFMQMDEGLDTGPVYHIIRVPIDNKNAFDLEIYLSEIGADTIESILEKISNGDLQPSIQDDSKSSYAGKIKKVDGLIDWNDSAEIIEAKVRAYYPWPGAFFKLQTTKKNITITITKAKILKEEISGDFTSGMTVIADKKRWVIACGNNSFLELCTLKPEGKNEMTGSEFVRGRPQLFKSKK